MDMDPNKLSMQEINLLDLNLFQLSEIKHQLEQQLSLFEESVKHLKLAQDKFLLSIDVLKKLRTVSRDNSVLVPLTQSLCVRGIVPDPKHVIIELGSGLYTLKTISSAKAFFKRKVAYVNEQIEKFQILGAHKLKIKEDICEVIESKSDADSDDQSKCSE